MCHLDPVVVGYGDLVEEIGGLSVKVRITVTVWFAVLDGEDVASTVKARVFPRALMAA